MASKTDIANLAISHLGRGKTIANLETESSTEAQACRTYYEETKKAVLIDHDWNFSSVTTVLGLVEETPNTEWKYSYRYPVNCLKIRRVLSGLRQDTMASLVPYKIVKDAAGLLIYTDQENAEVEYTEDITDSSYFPPQFVLALSFRMAAYVAPRITGGDPFKDQEAMLAYYLAEISRAKANNMNEGRLDKKPDSEFITARN